MMNMTVKRYKTAAIIIMALGLISNFVLIGYDFLSLELSADFRFDYFGINIDEPLKATVALAMMISVFFMEKTKIPLLISLCINALAEIIRLILTVKICHISIYNDILLKVIYTTVTMILLAIIACVVYKQNKHFKLLSLFCFVGILLYIAISVIPVLIFKNFYNITLAIQYISVFTLFIIFSQVALFGKRTQKSKRVQ